MAEATLIDASLVAAKRESREDLIRAIFRGYLNQDTGHHELTLIAIGETGQGKSALVNGLLGDKVAEEGNTLEAGTKKVKKHNDSDGIAVVWDTPGFGMDDTEKDKQKVEQIAKECAGQVDLILYCIRMDSDRWPKNSDRVTIRMMTEAFGSQVWRYCQFVLTFANRVVMISKEEAADDPDQFFSQRVWEFEEHVRETLKEHAHLSEEEIQDIHVIAVGDPRPRENKKWQLPTCEDWFVELWLAVSQRIQQSALPTLLKLNKHRLDLDENSLNPPAEEAEPHLRTLSYHAVCIDDLPNISLDCSEPTAMPSLIDPVEEQAANEPISMASPPSDSAAREQARDDSAAREQNRDDSAAREQARDDTAQKRPIPLYRIIYEQLKNEESAFKRYVKFYWEQEGQKTKVFGHLKGLVKGIKHWIKCQHGPAINWQEEQDSDYTSSI